MKIPAMVLQAPSVSLDGRRRSDRIEISLPIELRGINVGKMQDFVLSAETISISRHGAGIVVNHQLTMHQDLTLRCLNTKEEAEVRVVGLMPCGGDKLVYGVAFVDPNANPWGVEFPSLDGEDRALARVLLTCQSCSAQRIVYFNEIEIQVFQEGQKLQQFCAACSDTTYWRRLAATATILEKSKAPPKLPSPGTDSRNKRKHARVRTRVPACIREVGFSDEIVVCENISRGGISFRTTKAFRTGARIEVAIPFSAGIGNIFVPARIVHVQPAGAFFTIGLAYSGVSGAHETSPGYSGSLLLPGRLADG